MQRFSHFVFDGKEEMALTIENNKFARASGSFENNMLE